MIRVFIGFDHRQPVSYQVLHHSIMRNASEPVSITPLHLPQLPIDRHGLTPFTFSRFLVPWLCEYEGHGIFMDSDMLCRCDIAELWAQKDEMDGAAVAVREFTGREKFERASLMLFDNALCTELTPEYIQNEHNNPLNMAWAHAAIKALPDEFNRLVGYEACDDAKILHYTAGIPAYAETQKFGFVEPWMQEADLMNSAVPFNVLMGQSVHVQNLEMKEVARA